MSLSKLAARTFESATPRPYDGTSSDSDASSGLSKWQLALLIGAPVVVGGLVYYYYYSDDPSDTVDSTKPKSSIVSPGIKVRPAKSPSNAKSTGSKKSSLTLPAEILAKNKGNEFFRLHKYKEASECYSEAIKQCPEGKKEDLATFYQNRAASNEMLGVDAANIIADCSEALKLNPKYVKALVRRARAYEKIEKFDEALTDITAAIILESFGNQSTLQATDRILQKLSKVKARDFVKDRVLSLPSDQFIQHYFASFCRDPFFPSGSKVDADKLLSKLDQLKANATPSAEEDSRVNLLKGTIELLKGDSNAAHKYLNNVVSNTPSTISTADQDKIDIKVNALIKLASIASNSIDDNTAEVDPSNGRSAGRDKALEYFTDAIALDPSNADIYMQRSQLLILSEKAEESKSDLDKAVSLSPSFQSAVAQKFYVDYRFALRYGDFEKAKSVLEQFEEAADKFPDSSEILCLFAQSQMEFDAFDVADRYFLKALQADPSDANLYVHRAILFMRQGKDTPHVIKLIEKATSVDPKCQFAHEMLGTVLVQNGDLEEGIKSFEAALQCAQAEADIAHLFALREAAEAQLKASRMLGIPLSLPR